MRKIKLGKSNLEVPAIGIGFMRIRKLSKPEAEDFIQTAMDEGACYFDHADIYGDGKCEEIFAEAVHMTNSVREKIILQSKCGIIRGKHYDFSKKHILESVDKSLMRLKTDYLDVLLLHRPDTLMVPEEVAEAFNILQNTGKVLNFGVSNHNPMQVQLLQKSVRQPIIINQLQFSITNSGMIKEGFNVNMENDSSIVRDGGVLEFCRINDITIQPWSPFQYGHLQGTFLDNELFPELNSKLNEIGNKYNVSNTTIALAWILRHPANMVPIIGTMNKQRLKDSIKASDIMLTRDEWYEIYRSAGNVIP